MEKRLRRYMRTDRTWSWCAMPERPLQSADSLHGWNKWDNFVICASRLVTRAFLAIWSDLKSRFRKSFNFLRCCSRSPRLFRMNLFGTEEVGGGGTQNDMAADERDSALKYLQWKDITASGRTYSRTRVRERNETGRGENRVLQHVAPLRNPREGKNTIATRNWCSRWKPTRPSRALNQAFSSKTKMLIPILRKGGLHCWGGNRAAAF